MKKRSTGARAVWGGDTRVVPDGGAPGNLVDPPMKALDALVLVSVVLFSTW
jgi:hypothetical protein